MSRKLLFMIILSMLFLILAAITFQTSSLGLRASENKPTQDDYLPLIANVCWPYKTAAGALTNQPPPVFCKIESSGPGTATQENNSWLDEFDHALSFADFSGTTYKVYGPLEDIYASIHWRHANHWMVDLAPHASDDAPGHGKGATMMRPNRSFHFENSVLIVEADVAAGHEAYGNKAWPELIVSTGSHPLGHTPGSNLYAHDMFAGYWTLGCRLQENRRPICALRDNSGDYADNIASTRIWEMSWFQHVGTHVFGGNEFDGRDEYWRICQVTDPDILCRDRFRLELARTRLTLYVNGIKYFEQTGIPPLPPAMLNGDVFVYFASVDVGHKADTIRYHWDRVAINPNTPPSTADQFISSPQP